MFGCREIHFHFLFGHLYLLFWFLHVFPCDRFAISHRVSLNGRRFANKIKLSNINIMLLSISGYDLMEIENE